MKVVMTVDPKNHGRMAGDVTKEAKWRLYLCCKCGLESCMDPFDF
jgi:hypothetical protein